MRYLENRHRHRLQGSCLASSGCLASQGYTLLFATVSPTIAHTTLPPTSLSTIVHNFLRVATPPSTHRPHRFPHTSPGQALQLFTMFATALERCRKIQCIRAAMTIAIRSHQYLSNSPARTSTRTGRICNSETLHDDPQLVGHSSFCFVFNQLYFTCCAQAYDSTPIKKKRKRGTGGPRGALPKVHNQSKKRKDNEKTDRERKDRQIPPSHLPALLPFSDFPNNHPILDLPSRRLS